MSVKLPPLQLLRSFESAATHLSFKKAAEDLFVTPSAVSQQIKALESHLQVKLFQRKANHLLLTELGKQYFNVIKSAMKSIEVGFEKIQRQQTETPLRVGVLPFIANEFVIPNIPSLEANYPNIQLEILNSYQSDFKREALDICIKMTPLISPDVINEKLLDLRFTFVCSPTFIERENLQTIQDLRNKVFIAMPFWAEQIAIFEERLTINPFVAKKVFVFDTYLATLQAAEQGVGFTVGIFPYIQHWINQKRIVAPFSIRAAWEDLYLIYAKEIMHRKDVQAFRDWIFKLFAPMKRINSDQI